MQIRVWQKQSGIHANKATTKQYINGNIPLLYLAISRALSGSKTVHSASFTAFKKNIADMADLLKQMWFLMTRCTNYGIKGRQVNKRKSIKTLISELGRT
jgi:hypothetical protein